MRLDNVIGVVNDYGLEMVSEMIAILQNHGSKNLYSQIHSDLLTDLNSIIFEIKMPDYGRYASEGRNAGKFPPPDAISNWMQERNIDMAALYPISRKIATMGTKASASHFLETFKLTPEFEKKAIDAFSKDVQNAIIEKVNQMNQGK